MEQMPVAGGVVTFGCGFLNSAQQAADGDLAAADRSMEAAILPVPVLGSWYGFYRQAYEVGSLVNDGRNEDALASTGMFFVGFLTQNPVGGFFRPDVQDPELQRAMNRGGAVFEGFKLGVEIAAAVVGGGGGAGGGGQIIRNAGGGRLPNVGGGGVRGAARGPAAMRRLPEGVGRGPQRPGIFEMAARGNQRNHINELLDRMFPKADIAFKRQILRELFMLARKEGENAIAQAVKQAQKAIGGRRHR
jgi:hypothetical protein